MTDDTNEPQDPRVALFAPKSVPSNPTSRTMIARDLDAERNSVRTVVRDGVITTEYFGAKRESDYDAAAAADHGGPFAEIRDSAGWNPITADQLKPDSRVTLRSGASMLLKQAVDAGFVHLENGRYVEGPGARSAEAEKQQPQREQHPDLVVEPLPSVHAETVLESLQNGTQPGTQYSAVKELVETGELSMRRMGEIASQLGAQPDQVAAALEPVMAGFKAQADAVVASHGVDPETVYAWAWENKPEELKAAMMRHGTKRQTAGYTAIVRSYVENLDQISPQDVLNADLGHGITVRPGPRGRLVVSTPDGEFGGASAVRAGIIKLSRRG